MKTRMLVSILILVLAVLIAAGSCATKRHAISDEELSKAFTGTWINEEYEDIFTKKARIVQFDDGTFEEYLNITDVNPKCQGKYTILNKWKDSKGNIWIEARWECFTHRRSGNILKKISDSGNTLEELYTPYVQYKVEEWDPDDKSYRYRIYYRQE